MLLDLCIFIFAIISLLYVLFLQLLNLIFTIFSFRAKQEENKKFEVNSPPAIAILIPIYNEDPIFVVKQIRYYQTCLKYYAKFIFLIDDSNDEYWEPLIGELGRMYRFEIRDYKRSIVYYDFFKKIVIIHRFSRDGYKAGALNTALDFIREYLPIFDYVIIADIEWLPEIEFIKKCLREFQNNNSIAFVQAMRISISKSKLHEALNIAGDAAYLTNLAGRNYLKVPIIFTGSCAMFKYDILDKYRFREGSLTEDLEISIRLYLDGLRGKYVKKILCIGENHPASFNNFVAQLSRWAYGTTEILKIYLFKIMSNNVLKLKEKLVLIYQLSFFLIYFISFSLLILHSILVIFTFTGNASGEISSVYSLLGPILFNIPVIAFLLDLINIHIQAFVHPLTKSKIKKLILPIITVLAFWAATPFLFYSNLKAILGIKQTWIRTYKTRDEIVNIKQKIYNTLAYALLFIYVTIIYSIDISISKVVMPYHLLWIGAMFFGLLIQIAL